MVAYLSASLQFALAAAPARATDVPAGPLPVDVSPVLDQLVFAGDGKGHWVAMVPFYADTAAHTYWSHDGVWFNALRVTGASRQGTLKFDKVFWEPRVKARWQASVGMDADGWWGRCFDRKIALQPAAGPAAASMVAAVRAGKIHFAAPSWDRRPVALVRDDAGTYWYVDGGVGERAQHFRVFSGPRGLVKALPLVNVVSDSEGQIFATRSGKLRLVLGRFEASWIDGRGEKKLTVLPVDDNLPLIYGDLGAYIGQRLGTPCDDL